jgi:hypothetical protein
VSWSAWGGLLAAHGALGWRSARDWRAWSLIVAGVVVSLGGGEYGLALAPLIACCALWPNESGQPNWRQAIAIGAALAPLYAAYVAASVGFNDRGRLGTHYFVGTHVLAQIADNLGYLLLPKNWIRPLPCLALAGALLAVGCAVSRSFRARLLSWPSLLLLGSAVAALAPFSLSLAGNYYRFVYPAMAPFCGWLMFCAGGLIGPQSSPRGVGRRALVGVAVFLMVAGLINGRKRALDERRRGDEVARFVERFDVLAARHPGQPIDVYVDKDIESAIDTVVALGRIPRDNCHEGPPPHEEAPGQIALVATYAWGKPFEFRLLEPARKTAARTTPATDR